MYGHYSSIYSHQYSPEIYNARQFLWSPPPSSYYSDFESHSTFSLPPIHSKSYYDSRKSARRSISEKHKNHQISLPPIDYKHSDRTTTSYSRSYKDPWTSAWDSKYDQSWSPPPSPPIRRKSIYNSRGSLDSGYSGRRRDSYKSSHDNAYPSDNFSSGLVKKSMSQHSLPAATNAHKNKKHMFLKSGGGNRVKPTPLSSNAAPIGGARHSVPSVGGGVAGALKLMNSEEWQDKVDGINQICELSSSNPSQVVAQIHEVCMALLEECKNLRSSVSRVALSAFSTLFANLKSKMDGEIEKIGAVLMNKSGDVSSAFIRDDANDAIEKMITYGSPIKVLSVLINSGSKAKSNTIRASCSQFVSQLVQRVGVSNTLNSTDFLAKLIPILVNFARDQTPNVRQHAKSTLISLSDAHNFDAQLKKACMDSDVRAVKEIISHIHKKGGADGLDSTSTSLAGTLSRNGSFKKSAIQRKLPDNMQLDLDECRKDLSAASWESRLGGLKRFEELTKGMAKAVAGDTKLVEAFIGRLSDINGKVSLEAMDVYLATLPQMARYYGGEACLKAVLNQLLLALSSHLPSKSDEHRALAQKCLTETIKQIDNGALSPAIAAVTRKANVKQKPFMLHIFSKINENQYASKPKQVELGAIPILVEAMKTPPGDAENKKATLDFARSLARLMGEKALMDAIGGGLDPAKRQQIEGMIRR